MRLATQVIGMAALMLMLALGCAHKQPPPPAVPQLQARDVEYSSPSAHFSLRYPSAWSSRPTSDYVLLLERRDAGDAAKVTVDVPYIPLHLPGMVTMNRVVDGYVQNWNKRLTDFSVVERRDDMLAGSPAQRLVITGRDRDGARQGLERKLAALITIRNEQVYIVQANAPPESFDAALAAMTKIVRDWTWTN
ncbi:MAG TPA: hypothetical protein VH518_06540 [Tepidisphaeraceae bacterium]|jgi:hypothetical protein